MDARGAGDSEHTSDGYRVEQYAEDVIGMADHLGLGLELGEELAHLVELAGEAVSQRAEPPDVLDPDARGRDRRLRSAPAAELLETLERRGLGELRALQEPVDLRDRAARDTRAPGQRAQGALVRQARTERRAARPPERDQERHLARDRPVVLIAQPGEQERSVQGPQQPQKERVSGPALGARLPEDEGERRAQANETVQERELGQLHGTPRVDSEGASSRVSSPGSGAYARR